MPVLKKKKGEERSKNTILSLFNSILIFATPLVVDLSDFSSLPILTVPNAYLAVDDNLSLAALVDILHYQFDLRALPSSGKLITTLLQTTGRTINNFSSVNLTATFNLMSSRFAPPHRTFPPTPSSSPS
ncbi:hypothetical protein HKD37_12G034815 [Glycine soja]